MYHHYKDHYTHIGRLEVFGEIKHIIVTITEHEDKPEAKKYLGISFLGHHSDYANPYQTEGDTAKVDTQYNPCYKQEKESEILFEILSHLL
jgi:hypothetical protein